MMIVGFISSNFGVRVFGDGGTEGSSPSSNHCCLNFLLFLSLSILCCFKEWNRKKVQVLR